METLSDCAATNEVIKFIDELLHIIEQFKHNEKMADEGNEGNIVIINIICTYSKQYNEWGWRTEVKPRLCKDK